MSYDFSKLKLRIQETEQWLVHELSGVRTGRATPILLDGIKPEAYGTRTPLHEIANISVEDARTLRVVPWDVELLKAIEKGIIDANLGLGISTDDLGLRVSFPELTSERRTQLLKIAGDKTEHSKITLRSHRTEAIKSLEATEKDGGMSKDEVSRLKTEIQKLIDASSNSLVNILEKKTTEISK